MKTITFTTGTVTLDIELIRGLLTTAFEGGSNYWYQGLHIINDVDEPSDPEVHRFHIVPTCEGGSVGFHADDEPDTLLVLNLEAIREGLGIMREKYASHWADFYNENDDATTGDVFLQCCVFGEVIYG
jgi:hypothetical protein